MAHDKTGQAGPTDEEALVLALLLAGSTDAAVAAAVGASGRTVRRRLRSAMAKLGATSRFDAGYRLARSGWVLPDVGVAVSGHREAVGRGPGAANSGTAETRGGTR